MTRDTLSFQWWVDLVAETSHLDYSEKSKVLHRIAASLFPRHKITVSWPTDASSVTVEIKKDA